MINYIEDTVHGKWLKDDKSYNCGGSINIEKMNRNAFRGWRKSWYGFNVVDGIELIERFKKQLTIFDKF